MRVSKLTKDDWPIVLQYTFKTKVLEYIGDLNKIIKFVCVAMCSLVMSFHSQPINNIIVDQITQHLVFRW